jgi:hypothetical protein
VKSQPQGKRRLLPTRGLLHQDAFHEFAKDVVNFDEPQQVRLGRRSGWRLDQDAIRGDVAQFVKEFGERPHPMAEYRVTDNDGISIGAHLA